MQAFAAIIDAYLLSQASLAVSLSHSLSSHVLHNIIHTLRLNMCALLFLQLGTYHS